MIISSKTLPVESDSDLLVSIRSRNPRALETLYLRYHSRLARFISRVTPRHENIEEIINDTFMTVWKRASDFRQASQVSTWICGIAYRTALNSLRRQKNHTEARNLDDYPEQTIDPVRATEDLDWLTQGLNRLPLEQRLALELTYRTGYSVEEIAVITNSPVGTVKARMSRARQSLRKHLPALAGGSLESMQSANDKRMAKGRSAAGPMIDDGWKDTDAAGTAERPGGQHDSATQRFQMTELVASGGHSTP
jgi:RNA polymerase sigma-70 factor (ECF subfamily)